MTKLYGLIDRLITLCLENHLIDSTDTIYTRNRLLAMFNEAHYSSTPMPLSDLYETLDQLSAIAISKNLIEDAIAAKDNFTSALMNVFLDKPSQINEKFFTYHKISPKKATDYFYHLSQASNYIKVNRIAKNKSFIAHSPYGPIEITINLSKPEKDPKEIARMKSMPSSTYPKCLLCIEHEGYNGTLSLPDRSNHRMVRLKLNNKNWRLQYSPYLYYNEHCIVLSETHTPMQITKDTFNNLLSFVTFLPHYFIGSNADLPIVGGSILSHEHYQGGCYTFPLDHAKTLFDFELPQYPNIKARTLNWPLSTIELRSASQEELIHCSYDILNQWKKYSAPVYDILSETDGTPHNTITPICRRDGEDYLMRLVLRNNRTSDQYPLGIFHPHPDVHHIKKENIGLIEVMGLAILPGRLLTELECIKNFIKGETSHVPEYHKTWADTLKATYTPSQDLDTFIQQSVGDQFTRVLEDSGVYKLTPDGIEGFKAFIQTLKSS